MKIDNLIFARWIVPVEPKKVILENHAVAIKDGKIEAIVSESEAREQYEPLQEQHLKNHLLIPGLINSHTHAAMNLFRGLADDLPLMTWLNEHIWPAEQRWVSADFVEDGSRLAIAEMIRSGTTCFSDMYFFAEQTANVASLAGIRAVIGLILLDFPTAWAQDADEYLLKAGQVHHKFRHSPLIRTSFAPHSPYAVSDAPLQQLLTLAEEMDLPIHMHIHETADEIQQSLKQYGQRPLERLERLGFLSPRLLAVHMTQLKQNEIELLAHHRVNVIHCPESNLKLASGFCPVHTLKEAGVNIAIGTDSAASNNDLDMLAEMRTTALLTKGVSGNPEAGGAFEVLEMATLNAAKALGMDKEIGSIRKDKQADLTAIDLSELETQPLHDPVSQLIYSASRHQVSDVWVAGKQLLRSRELLTLNEKEILASAQSWRQQF